MGCQYLDFTAIDIERAVEATYTIAPASCEPGRGSINRDGEGSADDGEDLYKKRHGVGWFGELERVERERES